MNLAINTTTWSALRSRSAPQRNGTNSPTHSAASAHTSATVTQDLNATTDHVSLTYTNPSWRYATIPTLFDAKHDQGGWKPSTPSPMQTLFSLAQASQAYRHGANLGAASGTPADLAGRSFSITVTARAESNDTDAGERSYATKFTNARAAQSYLASTEDNIQVFSDNLEVAKSQIADASFAHETFVFNNQGSLRQIG